MRYTYWHLATVFKSHWACHASSVMDSGRIWKYSKQC